MRYLQVLLKNRNRYQLCWIPELYCIEGKILKIRGDWNGEWEVKEVYRDDFEEVKVANKVIWASKVNPILEGEKLQERLRQYRKMKKLINIEEA